MVARVGVVRETNKQLHRKIVQQRSVSPKPAFTARACCSPRTERSAGYHARVHNNVSGEHYVLKHSPRVLTTRPVSERATGSPGSVSAPPSVHGVQKPCDPSVFVADPSWCTNNDCLSKSINAVQVTNVYTKMIRTMFGAVTMLRRCRARCALRGRKTQSRS